MFKNTYINKKCLSEGTLITLLDKTTKPIEDLTYNDKLLTYNKHTKQLEEKPILWLMEPVETNSYTVIKLENGTTIKTNSPCGATNCHRFYCTETGRYENANVLIGKHVKTIDGETKVIGIEIVEQPTKLYNLISEVNMSYFANGVLSATGFANSIMFNNNIKYGDRFMDGLDTMNSNENNVKLKSYIEHLKNTEKR